MAMPVDILINSIKQADFSRMYVTPLEYYGVADTNLKSLRVSQISQPYCYWDTLYMPSYNKHFDEVLPVWTTYSEELQSKAPQSCTLSKHEAFVCDVHDSLLDHGL